MSTIPVINIHKCDGDGKCVAVCPNDVFEMYTLTKEQVKSFPFKGWLKVKIKGANKSNPVHSLNCIACGLCVENCHEHAIELISR
ncbi:MAG: ferredoxin family protein [Prolixibacteraceae bacterium]